MGQDARRDHHGGMVPTSEAFIRLFQASAPVPMGIVEVSDDRSDILHIYDNPATCHFFGTAPGSTAGRWARAELGVPAPAVQLWIDHYRACHRTGQPSQFSYEHPGDRPRWLEVVVSHIGAGDAGRQRFCYVATEVTDRKEAEEKVRLSEERFRRAADAAGALVYEVDLLAGEAAVVHGLERVTGLPSPGGPLSSAWWHSLIHPADLVPHLEALGRYLTEGRVYRSAYRIRHADGSWRHVEDVGEVLRDDDGRPVRLVGTILDITPRTQAREALTASEERLRDLFENAYDVIYTLDLSGRLLTVNRAGEQLLGYSREEIVGQPLDRILPPEALEQSREMLARKLRGEGVTTYELDVMRRDGRRVTLEVSSRLMLADGVPVGVQGIARDVTERRQAAEVLREADRRKDQFLAMLAHELRNPLGPIRNAVAVLNQIEPGDGPARQAREMIERQVGHMARLIDDLLDVSRLARGKVLLRREACDFAAIVRETVEDYRGALEARGLIVGLTLPGEPQWVEGDRTRLAQVIGNVLHNAGKFTDPGGRVGVTLEASPGAARVTIADTGIGMSAETLAGVFEAFSQAEGGTDRGQGGLGLGMALVKGLIELHGGQVTAHSEGPGRGTTVTLSLPLMVAHPLPKPVPATAPREAARRVLVVEDLPDAAESMRLLLSLLGHRVEVASTGSAALEAARLQRPEVVLCDIGLPGGMTGYDVARALRSEPVVQKAYLIALTGYGQEEDVRRAREAGFDLHLIKPVDIHVLRRALAGLVGEESS